MFVFSFYCVPLQSVCGHKHQVSISGALIIIILNHYCLFIIVFLVHPESISVVEGTTVEFTCTANNTDGLSYIVNGIAANEEPNPSNGFTQQNTELLDNTNNVRRLNLTVITSAENNNNNSEIHCQAVNIPDFDNSDTATLTIQGTILFDYTHYM